MWTESDRIISNDGSMKQDPSTHAASPGSGTPTIEAVGLRKTYKETHALDGLDITCAPGQVTALLGPNGAGKTTFVKMVSTLSRPDAGTLRVCGIDAVADPIGVRRLIGLAGQNAAVEAALTGRENLVMVAKFFGHRGANATAAANIVLKEIGLEDDADRLVREYSGGMRRRLDLGASLVGAPRLLLLDEPTTGLDPRTRLDLWDSIRSLVANGTDVLLTTQYLEEADRLADHIVIIDHGRVVAQGSPAELKSKAGDDILVLTLTNAAELDGVSEYLNTLGEATPRADVIARTITCAVHDGPTAITQLLATLSTRSISFDDIALRRPTLDEVFLTLTGAVQ
jgi:ABC-2 type transport system ATP-binding protein